MTRHLSLRILPLFLAAFFAVGCGGNEDLELDDIVLAPDLELLRWDFDPILTQGQGSDLVIELRNKGAIDARRFRVEATLLKIILPTFNSESNVIDYLLPSRNGWGWANREDIQFLGNLTTLNVNLPVNPTTTGQAILEITLDSREELADPDRSDNTNTAPCSGSGFFSCDVGKPFGDLVNINGASQGTTFSAPVNN